MTKSQPWSPIEDLPEDWEGLADPEISALAAVWQEQKARLRSPESLRRFNERLVRTAAIETGIVERLYSLDRGVTTVLIEQGLDATIPSDATDQAPERVSALIRDQHDAVQGLFDFVTGTRTLSTGYIKELHAQLTRHQPSTTAMDSSGRMVEVPLRRGEWKLRPNNPVRPDGAVHEYCPPEQTASEMDRLVRLHLEHQQAGVPAEVEAAWLHHRFTQIHPFQDGNGRVARCLATLVLIRAGRFPFVLERDDRQAYLESLERADGGDLQALVDHFVTIEKRAFVRALSLVDEVKRTQRVSDAIQAVKEDLLRKRANLRDRRDELLEITRQGWNLVSQELTSTRQSLEEELAEFDFPSTPRVDQSWNDEDGRSHWFRHQVIETAKALGYFANVSEFHSWARLQLGDESRSEILVSFHTMGREYAGVFAVSACFFRRESEGGHPHPPVVDLQPLSRDVFQLNYAEPPESSSRRLARWSGEVLTSGLDLWRRGL